MGRAGGPDRAPYDSAGRKLTERRKTPLKLAKSEAWMLRCRVRVTACSLLFSALSETRPRFL